MKRRADTGERVIRAAMKWYRVEQGYFYRNGIVKNMELARKLEQACATHAAAKRGRK